MTTSYHHGQHTPAPQATATKGFPVRTNLRAGLAWDDMDDEAKELWNKLSCTVANATNSLTAGSSTDKAKA